MVVVRFIKMNLRNWRHRAEYLVFKLVICLLQILSLRQSVQLAKGLAYCVHNFLPRKLTRYQVARENLKIAFGECYSDQKIDRTIYDMWVHLFRMIIEIAQLSRKLRLSNCDSIINFRFRDETVRVLCSGRPVIFLGGHFGNWEMANSTFGLFGFPMGVVARDLDNPYLHNWFKQFREATGHLLISKKGGYDQITQILKRNGFVAMLCDQDAGSRGQFVHYFGKPASTFKSIALLALEHRAVICVGYARRLPVDLENHFWVQYELGIDAIIDPDQLTTDNEIHDITQRYTSALERAVRRSPEQYFWVHRRWKSVPRKRKQRLQRAA